MTPKTPTGGCCLPPICSALHDLVGEAGEEYYQKWPATGDRLAQPMAFQDAVLEAVRKAWLLGQNMSPAEIVERVGAMSRSQVAEAIAASHPMEVETNEAYDADVLAMELIHGRHDKREIVNLIRWILMGCP